MEALISPHERVSFFNGSSGFRVAQTSQESFEVAPPLFWVDCPSNCVADVWYYDEAGQTCQPKPIPDPGPETPVEVMP